VHGSWPGAIHEPIVVSHEDRPVAQHPFRFLADARGDADRQSFAERARRAESLGYHGLVVADHLVERLSPVPALATVAAVTEHLRISAFVFNNDLRHPAVLAQDLATLDVLSDGRLDVAIGAGWNRPEYDAIGLPFDPPRTRQARLAEAVAVLKGAFGDGPFSFHGEHYRITDHDGQPKPVQRPHPPFLIGGGGRRTLELAGREAQIVGLAPRVRPIGGVDAHSLTMEAAEEKLAWVRAAAGDRYPELTINIYPSTSEPMVTDHPLAAVRRIADRLNARPGTERAITAHELLESPHLFIGSIQGLTEKFVALRERLGVSSIMVGEMGLLDPVVERLAGT
jgi:probable F420-dependent oxidoreductase